MTAVTAVAARAAAPADTTPRPPTPRAVVGKVVWVVAVVLISVTTVMPLLWTLATSLKPEGEILSSYLQLLPSNPTLANYVALFTDGPFGRYLANSAIIALGGVATNLFFGGLAGYALAKLSFRGRGVVFSMFLGSMMVPGIITMVPTFLVLRRFPLVGGNDLFGEGGAGFINSYGAVLIPFAAGPFAVFFMRQFFQALPDELGDAARIDGASEFRIFWSVYLPLARAGLAVLGVLTFQAGWNSFLWPLIALNDPDMLTVQVGLAGYVNEYQTQYGPLLAGTILASLPVLVVFVLAQRYIIENFAHSGTK
ncbi:carbohydrate ABC transporter permease [Promicromonospora thailandica]|uniref:Carbohydrate ABC transporter membrane protein 2, CUT1 family (TC 3.A.1.1.-) n=1 Tax=Promicromonospora thailandica TaxID=765201 RepID=A0A9X2GCV8_9MICO|nr:carbohydrate ABC transporter permease [Promicromonospora thailandica]MCP2267489.1 carbohydrate ABC transporter membrane protein 2, CUT1 family (TC 3.A.1.1.-) [Promicromonospora thailandica]